MSCSFFILKITLTIYDGEHELYFKGKIRGFVRHVLQVHNDGVGERLSVFAAVHLPDRVLAPCSLRCQQMI